MFIVKLKYCKVLNLENFLSNGSKLIHLTLATNQNHLENLPYHHCHQVCDSLLRKKVGLQLLLRVVIGFFFFQNFPIFCRWPVPLLLVAMKQKKYQYII